MQYRIFLGAAFLCLVQPFAGQAQDAGTLFMEMERRVGALEETVQELTGKIEELQHALKAGRILEGTSSSAPSSLVPSAGVQGPVLSGSPMDAPFGKARGSSVIGDSLVETAPLPPEGRPEPKNEQEAYDAARKLLGQGAYEEAELAFKSFIETYKQSPLVVNAQYWLGETYYGRQDYARSSVAFMEAYKTYHAQLKKGSSQNHFAKAPESLIKLIFSLKGLGKKKNACATYKQLRKEFPKLPLNLERLAKRSLEGLNCS